MKFYDTDTHEIFEATDAEFRAALDDYNDQWQRDIIMGGGTPFMMQAGPVLKGHRHFIHKLNEEYVMIKFEDKFVHFRWTEELRGKMCFVADEIQDLEQVFRSNCRYKVVKKHDSFYTFEITSGTCFRFAYYDPNYDCKVAFNEGKQIQGRGLKTNPWMDVDAPAWEDDWEYRIKPEEPSLKWTDLKVGDVIRTTGCTSMVTAIEERGPEHIFAGMWITDNYLEEWRKL